MLFAKNSSSSHADSSSSSSISAGPVVRASVLPSSGRRRRWQWKKILASSRLKTPGNEKSRGARGMPGGTPLGAVFAQRRCAAVCRLLNAHILLSVCRPSFLACFRSCDFFPSSLLFSSRCRRRRRRHSSPFFRCGDFTNRCAKARSRASRLAADWSWDQEARPGAGGVFGVS